VRLRHAYCITADEVTKRDPDGTVRAIRATIHPESTGGKNPADGRKVSGVIHWVDTASSTPAAIRLYDRLFKTAKPEEGGENFLNNLNPGSLETVVARLEASLANAKAGSRWQLERVGYFIVDTDSVPGSLVFNRIISLKEDRVVPLPAIAKATATDPTVTMNPKAAKRPKGKSNAEYRAEARARDESLAKDFEQIKAMVGEAQADLLAGDKFTSGFFLDAISNGASADIAAKWMINELPRALGDTELDEAGLDPAKIAALLKLVATDKMSPSIAKAVLVEMVTTGKAPEDTDAAKQGAAVGVVDIGAAVQAVIAANPEKAAQYKAGKTGLLGFFVGQVMKSAPGANPNEVNEAVRTHLA
jgi:glutaminyl-tRNA synthetase